MLAQLFATILSDRYHAAIDNASTPADLGHVSAMLDDAEERGALAGDELDQLRELVQQRREVLRQQKKPPPERPTPATANVNPHE